MVVWAFFSFHVGYKLYLYSLLGDGDGDGNGDDGIEIEI